MTSIPIMPHPPEPPDRLVNQKQDFPPLVGRTMLQTTSLGAIFNQKKYAKFLEIDFGQAERRHVNPYRIIDNIEQITSEKPKELSGLSKHKLTLKTCSKEQTEKCLAIKSLAEVPCTVRLHPHHNTCRGLIRLKQYDLEDMDEFKENLMDQYDICKVEKADFIKSRNGETSYIITFNEEKLPYSVYIPGELADSMVQPFGSRPMLCKNCFSYGHTNY